MVVQQLIKGASHMIGHGTRTNEFVRQVEKWQTKQECHPS
jgi:hypothetical protein